MNGTIRISLKSYSNVDYKLFSQLFEKKLKDSYDFAMIAHSKTIPDREEFAKKIWAHMVSQGDKIEGREEYEEDEHGFCETYYDEFLDKPFSEALTKISFYDQEKVVCLEPILNILKNIQERLKVLERR